MSRHEKLLQKIIAQPAPKDVKWDELKVVLEHFGYRLLSGAGSRRKFVHPVTQDVIALHEPHPAPEVKAYVLRQVADKLREQGLIGG